MSLPLMQTDQSKLSQFIHQHKLLYCKAAGRDTTRQNSASYPPWESKMGVSFRDE